MAQPNLNWYGTAWCWSTNRDPTDTEPLDEGFIQLGNLWINTTNGNIWMCWNQGDNAGNGLQWAFWSQLVLPGSR